MEMKTIVIVGASELGCRLAYLSTLAGFRTILEDISPSALEQGIARIAQALGDDLARGKIHPVVRDTALASLTTANSAEDASREADLIIEAVSDEMEMKVELFTIFDKFARPGAIFASSTTSLSITEMAAVTFCPDRCVGLRFFRDLQKANRLEIVKGRETSEETITACRVVGRRMDMDVFILSDEHAASANAAG